MNSRRCCQEHPPSGETRVPSAMKRIAGALEWAIPGVIVVAMPKCPACVAAYIALATGVGISFTAAAQLRMLVLVLSLTALTWFAIKALGRFRNHEVPSACRALPKPRCAKSPTGEL